MVRDGFLILRVTKLNSSNTLSPTDYFSFTRVEHSLSDLKDAGPWDIFLSSFDGTERVCGPFEAIQASSKYWIVHEEYGFRRSEYPTGAIPLSDTFDTPDIFELIQEWKPKLRNAKICIDSTGFIRPHLLVLFRALSDVGVRDFDVLYSDPVRYIEDERTRFTSGPILRVEQVPGFAGIHSSSGAVNDVLVIGAGYDYGQIMRACESKRNSKKYILTGLPSLQPHMYQESVLRINQASEAIGPLTPEQQLYASANHPFTVAQVLRNVVEREGAVNLYLCPVGPKPHVIGFALYYLRELETTSSSIIYPFAEGYAPSTSQGIRRTWQYRVEFKRGSAA